MSKPTGINHSTLSWVKKELDETLKQAAEALEAHAEDPSDVTQLQFCGTHLHQVHGILQMLELFGAAMLVEEMEQVVDALVAEQVSTRQEAYEVLMRAILQLSDYLERIQGGLQDIPILILPLLNDLRAARGANLLTENALFSPNLDSVAATPRRARLGSGTLAERARKLRHRYQLGLLGVLREQNLPKSLKQMLDVLDKLDEASEDDQVGTVWWVGGGLVEALSFEAVDRSPAVKMLLGQVDRQIKRAADQGEVSLSLEPPRELIKNLLYYVARSETVGERVPAIQSQYALKDLLLDENELEQAREGMSGPNSEILRTVSDAIKEDLTAVKDNLDLYARGGAKDPEKLAPIVDSLRRIGDTLGVLGLGVPRSVVKEQIALVEAMLRDGTVPDEQGLMSMAESLLYVESALDGLTKRQPGDAGEWLFSPESSQPEDRARSERELSEIEFKQVYGTAINEAMADVGRIKEAIVKFIEGGSGDELDDLDSRFASVCGALRLLDLDRAALLLQAAGRYAAENVLAGAATPDAESLDSLADAITSIEYYLEAVREGHADPAPILDVAAGGLDRLGYLPQDREPEAAMAPSPVEPEHDFVLPDFELADDAAPVETIELQVEEDGLSFDLELAEEMQEAEPALEPMAELASDPSEVAAPAAEVAPKAEAPMRKSGRLNYEVPLLADTLDQDILEIFTEEAEEVLETLGKDYPRWRDNPDDAEALATIRRMFHTLKGSGRLAGALLLGELAWSQENLLNRVLDHTIEPDGEVHQTIERCLQELPALVENIRGGAAPALEPILAIMQRAEILSDPSRHGELAALDAAAAEPVAAEAMPLDITAEEAEPTLEISEELVAELPAAEEISFEIDLPAAEAAAEQAETADDAEIIAEAPFFEDVELGVEAVEAPETAEEEITLDWSEPESGADAPGPAEEITLEWSEPEASGDTPEDIDGEISFEAPAEVLDAEDFSGTDFNVLAEPASIDEIELSAEPAALEEAPTEVLLIEAEPVMDPVLHDIFSRETADHLAAVRRFIDDARSVGGPAPVTEALVRALHTMTGSARMAGVDNISRVGRKFEAYAEHHLAEERSLSERDLVLLEQGANLVEQLVSSLADPGAELPDIEPLLAAVDAVAQDAPAIAAVEEEEEPAVVESTMEVDSDLVELFLEEAEDILRFLESTVQRWEDEPDHAATIAELHRSLHTLKGGARLAGFQGIGALCHALEGVSGDVADHKVPGDDRFFSVLHASLDRLGELVEQAKAGSRGGIPEDILTAIAELRGGGKAAPLVVEQDFGGADNELIEVFLEEATEILEAQEAALHAWQEEPENVQLITEVQRALHTLKGGARMAGFGPIGNLSHAFETMLLGVQSGRTPVTPALFDLLERVHDRLFSMREQAAAGQKLVEASDLIGEVEAAREGRAASAAEAEPEPAPEPSPAVAAEAEPAPAAAPVVAPAPAPKVERPEPAEQAKDERAHHDVVRVRADLLDNLVNFAGEVSIYRARLDQQVGAMRFNLTEFDQTVTRLREQLRTLEIETEAQMLYRFEREQEFAGAEDANEDFDPLEFDRFSRMQELSRALSESVNDLVSIQGLLDNLSREAETLLLQQSRVNTELQDGLMRTRMVPFANLVPRMRRIVRQTCQELGKQAQFKVLGAQGEMDRTVLERVTPPLEHMLRNAVAHGVESPEARAKAGKGPEGTITVALSREGADVVIRVSDDGGGIKLEAIRKKAVQMGLMPEKAPLSDREVMQFILEAGFSTAEQVTQIAGRGVGMDVVASEIKQLGGTLEIDSTPTEGTVFTIRLPFTLAINQALLCQAGEDVYAIPLTSIEGIARMTHEELEHCFANPHKAYYDYANARYEVKSLSQLLAVGEPVLPGVGKRSPIILVHTGDHRLAIQVDTLIGNREIVVKSVGPQISSVPGIQGATILADGRVVLILDVSSLVRLGITAQLAQDVIANVPVREEPANKVTIMVVDDSITMRKVATRLLERNGYEVVTAKDGVDAVARLQEVLPDGMLLDIEMPRMDGYELATHMRNDSRLKDVPIIMITSRTGEKHRQRAMEIGVNRYLGKPYQESDLLENLREVLEEQRGRG